MSVNNPMTNAAAQRVSHPRTVSHMGEVSELDDLDPRTRYRTGSSNVLRHALGDEKCLMPRNQDHVPRPELNSHLVHSVKSTAAPTMGAGGQSV